MKVLVLGGGVIGVTSAWYLQRRPATKSRSWTGKRSRAGNQPGQRRPDVVGRQHALGRARHSAQGAEMDVATAFAAGAAPASRSGDVVLAVQMLANCTSARYAINRERMLRLSRYSHECLVALRRETGIHYDEHTTGILELFRTARELDDAMRDAALLEMGRGMPPARPQRLRRARTGAASVPGEDRRRPASSRRRIGRLFSIHAITREAALNRGA